ncbi:hypothetical protein ACZ87_03818 [Candidatus Erwinia dacicola]|uniref:Uncharacterized protein n=1 Tax=Candidatus Erwinia dacicola TaxID=252393 RepID=A0A328TEY8_9GAMM|nr:hypothetical protein ACZ87_03818 [Candidatus Erwinia dacicola]
MTYHLSVVEILEKIISAGYATFLKSPYTTNDQLQVQSLQQL